MAMSFKRIVTLAVIGGCHGFAITLWQILETQPPSHAFQTIFGEQGERGEYMDGYSPEAMMERCLEDYKWESKKKDLSFLATERANMMAHLYGNPQLWEYVSMVAFPEHYLFEEAVSKPFDMFQRQKKKMSRSKPIFSGVVWNDWNKDEPPTKPVAFREKGIDYVRLHCNFGSAEEIGEPTQLADNSLFSRLARAAKQCQEQEMVPLVLMQVPWREPEGSIDYFEQAMKGFASALTTAGVESKQVLLETRPPIGVSAREERGFLSGTTRISLGLETGQRMFEAIEEAFFDDDGNNKIAGFCVAGGSTKGDVPTAMEDDTQNAVRQGMRQRARQQWGYDLCFWEMGAKLMLQPKVGRLWGKGTKAGRDAARELFCVNAEDMADEIKKAGTPPKLLL